MNEPSDNRAASTTPKWVQDLAHDANVFPICFFIALFVFVAFYPCLRNGFVGYDDDEYVTANAAVYHGLTWSGLEWAFTHQVSGNWHPLTMISHMLDCSIFGPKPWGHHFTSLLFHAANTILVFIVLRRLTRAAGRSLIAALLFGLHPLRVESVAWVAERKDVLSGFFWLLTIWAYAGYVKESAAQSGKAKSYYFRAILLFVLGLLCKPMLVTLPFVLLLLDFWPLKRVQEGSSQVVRWKALIVEKVPFFVFTAASCVVTYLTQKSADAITSDQFFLLRAENAMVAYWRYIGKLLWPTNLTVLYPTPVFWPIMWVWLATVALVAMTYIAFCYRATLPYVTLGWLWYVGTLVPVIGLVQVGGQSMADRYTYIPIIGLLVLIVWGLEELTQSWRAQAAVATVACALVSLACITATHAQIKYWQDTYILFQHALAVTKNNGIADNNLGALDSEKGRLDQAITELKESAGFFPDSAKIHYNLALALSKAGRYKEAIAQYRIALHILPGAPRYHGDLALTLALDGRVNEAFHEFQESIRISPNFPDVRCNYADELVKKGRFDEAIEQYQAASKLSPDYERAKEGLAYAMQYRGTQPKSP